METIKRYYLIFITLNSLLNLFILRFSLLKQIINYRPQGKVIFLHLSVHWGGGGASPGQRPASDRTWDQTESGIIHHPIAGADI